MKSNIHAVNFNATEELVAYVQKKIKKLEVFSDRIVNIDVYMKAENTSDKENKISEIKVHVPGEELVVKKRANSFEKGIDMCERSLERMVKKWKEKNKKSLG